MSDESPTLNQSITPKPPEVIDLGNDPKPPKHPILIITIAIAGMILFILILGGIKALQISHAVAKGKAFKMPPDAVTSILVKESNEAPVLQAVGSLTSPRE